VDMLITISRKRSGRQDVHNGSEQDSTAHIPSPVTRTLTSASYYQTGLIPKSVRLPCAQIFCRLIRVILFENIRMTVSVTT
jgi:hypothetical protein